jgi:hypothetical protein
MVDSTNRVLGFDPKTISDREKCANLRNAEPKKVDKILELVLGIDPKLIISMRKKLANRRNAQHSTGPKTERGKMHSRRNALKHCILVSSLLITEGEGAEDPAEFQELLGALRRDRAPVGTLENMLVEKIAICQWRQNRCLCFEAGVIRKQFAQPNFDQDSFNDPIKIRDYLRLPSDKDLDRMLRYETANNRQLAYAINELERLQRARKGEHVPAPVSIQVSSDK